MEGNAKLIEIPLDRPGYERFIGAWALEGEINMVIDVGPSNPVHHLIDALKGMHWDRVDFVLLTHIHIDHAGGLADFLEAFPSAKAVAHRAAIKHLVDPSRLWAGSKKVLGEFAEFYGVIKPSPRERLIPHPEADLKGLDIVETPGHAAHHLSFCYHNELFVGEAAGNYFVVDDKEYLRPATPPVFFLPQFQESLERLLALKDQTICYSHFGRGESSHRLIRRFWDQLSRWGTLIKKEVSRGSQDLMERCINRVLADDPELVAFKDMSPAVQRRERYFMANSLNGYMQFLQTAEMPRYSG